MITLIATLAIVSGSHAPLAAPHPKLAATPAVVVRPAVVVSPAIEAAWMNVAQCENGGQNVDGPVYSGMLGISLTNWYAYGGTQFAPTPYGASFDEQIIVAMRIQAGAPVPDRYSCSAW
ncbi:MAG: transglycosylase family protein [Nitrospiraceae bacterium]|nr:transglycosylase family protein [Nitrospiraceae bacterium]MDA8375372.1 transglycosylase family protein [Actinomycetota bacterium]